MSLPYRLPVDYAVAILLVFVAIFTIHWLRRAFRQPARSGPSSAVELPGGSVKAYDVVQRLFHWSLFVTLGLVALTGIDIFEPGVLGFFLSPFGIVDMTSSLFWHTTLLWILLGIVAVHIVWDLVVARGWRNIWVKRQDFRDTATRLKNFFGATKDYPKSGKYDVFMKTFHWGAVLSFVVLGVSGIYLWNPYGFFPGISPNLDALFRILHDTFAFLFVGLIIGHIYFAALPVNWPVLRSMVTGRLPKDDYLKEFDSNRWPTSRPRSAPKLIPNAKAATTEAEPS
ncbi:MAG: cytochrome b/b6 domain-containing protein [Nitrososphaerota archaeon]|nr:cytochrome b/b6 domain-containing protein [Nitrososphaerota archaeon]MDG7023287.1 cytochrome b/b6 domain-containing protein [Nitrososphaerota archaeon]